MLDSGETDPTQPFDVAVGQNDSVVATLLTIGSTVIILLLVLVVTALSLRHYVLLKEQQTPAK
ncbi:hypothetical protein L0Y40_01195 [Candidatus Wolfebacteria bacterium]|nr:hypothetical protein [Candidatus Wolfebacteria bacterium]